MTIALPADVKLWPAEAVIFDTLNRADGAIVSHAELEAALAGLRDGPRGRPLKVVLHYLRKKLVEHRIVILNVQRKGFRLQEAPAPQA